MNCDDLALRLLDDGEPPATDSLEAHLEGCPSCRERVAALRRWPGIVTADARPLSSNLRDRILAAAFEPASAGFSSQTGATAASSSDGFSSETAPSSSEAPRPLTPIASPPSVAAPTRRPLRFLAPLFVAACLGLGALLAHSGALPGPVVSPAKSPDELAQGSPAPETPPTPTTRTPTPPAPTSPAPTSRLEIAPVGSSAPPTAPTTGLVDRRDGALTRDEAATIESWSAELAVASDGTTSQSEVGALFVAVVSGRDSDQALARLESIAALSSDEAAVYSGQLALASTSSERLRVCRALAGRCVATCRLKSAAPAPMAAHADDERAAADDTTKGGHLPVPGLTPVGK